jgi:histidyl-tRNA synthetase
VGQEEQETHKVMVKNMITGEQKLVSQAELVNFLRA